LSGTHLSENDCPGLGRSIIARLCDPLLSPSIATVHNQADAGDDRDDGNGHDDDSLTSLVISTFGHFLGSNRKTSAHIALHG
jgi:hypothetical protein